MTTTKDLLKILEEYEKTPDSRGYDLRLDLADIVLRHLRDKGWTQKALADAAGMKAPFLTRIIHAAQNCTFDVAGRLLFALGVRAKLMELAPSAEPTEGVEAAVVAGALGITGETYHGQPSVGHVFDQTVATTGPVLSTATSRTESRIFSHRA
jgi:hypothetical protein